MARTLVSLVAPLLVTAFAAQADAQFVSLSDGQGMWTGDAVGLQWQSATVNSRLVVRDAGLGGATTAEWSSARFGVATVDHPDYSPQALFEQWVPQLFGQSVWNPLNPQHNPTLGGWSTGGDLTPPVNVAGVLQIAQGAPMPLWYNLSWTVDGESNGADRIRSFTPFGSQLIRSDFVNTVRTEFTLNQIGGLQPSAELTALDWGMGLISETPGGSPTVLQSVRNRIYFTVAQAWIDAYQPGIVGGSSGFPLKSNEIYGMDWDGSRWLPPVVVFSETELFGGAEPEAEIDAISIYGRAQLPLEDAATAVFSLTRDSSLSSVAGLPNQILVTQQGANHPLTSVSTTSQPLSVQLGSGPTPPTSTVTSAVGLVDPTTGSTSVPDNITGLCGRDPFSEGGAVLDPYKATPTVKTEDSTGIELSVLRHSDCVDDTGTKLEDTLRFTVSGVQEKGFDLVVAEINMAFYSIDPVTGGSVLMKKLDKVVRFVGAADAELIGTSIAPSTIDGADELRMEAVIHGLSLNSQPTVKLNLASSSSVSLGLQ